MRFDLGIEKLFFSKRATAVAPIRVGEFPSRNREAFLFKPYQRRGIAEPRTSVSISELRSFSFQIRKPLTALKSTTSFRSRNREAFLFKLTWVLKITMDNMRFDLGIEKLFFSKTVVSVDEDTHTMFRSRNREAFLFKL